MKNFIAGVQAVLPNMEAMREILEEYGFPLRVTRRYDMEVGCRWNLGNEFALECMLSLGSGDRAESARISLLPVASRTGISVNAQHENGRSYWCFGDEDIPNDSPLAALADDIRARCAIHPDGRIRDDVNAHNAIDIIVSFFVQHGGAP